MVLPSQVCDKKIVQHVIRWYTNKGKCNFALIIKERDCTHKFMK